MEARVFDKSRLPSRHVSVGPAKAPHRSYYYAMGMTAKQIAQPFVGVASCWNEAAPCNISLMRQAQAAKKGVASAGGTPREFCTITVTDGIAMGHAGMYASLPSRDLIADSVELTMRGHGYDALIGLAGCDKSLPGMMMAMVRMNVPSIFIYGGSILPGSWKGQPITVQDMFEAVGKNSVGSLSDEDLDAMEQVACPSAGACGAQFTANTMATVSEAIGLALPYSAGAPAPYEIRDQFCTLAGEKIMELLQLNLRPRDIVTRKALENAAAVVAAALGDTSGLARAAPQVVELGAADTAIAGDFDLVDPGGVDEERSLDADAVGGDAADREVLVDPTAAAADHHALEDLNTLAVALDHLRMHANGVSGAELRHIFLELLRFDGANQLRNHGGLILCSHSGRHIRLSHLAG